MDGDVADQSMMENKILHDDVPQRYKNIKLMPDWYAGPSKRTKKRKHRKQHGKIGFLELSKTISKRWSQLDQVDPETKSFVQKIAKSEVAEYYKEMNKYKELIKLIPPSLLPPKKKKKEKKKTKKRTTMEEEQQQKQQVSGGPDISSLLELEQQGCSKKMKTFHLQEEESSTPLSTSPDNESIVTSKKIKNSKFVRRVTIDNDSITEVFDSNIFNNDQPLNFDDLFCQPIGISQPIGVEVMMDMGMMNEDPGLQHSISSCSLSTSRSYPDEGLGLNSPLAEVDLCDDEILKLWESSI